MKKHYSIDQYYDTIADKDIENYVVKFKIPPIMSDFVHDDKDITSKQLLEFFNSVSSFIKKNTKDLSSPVIVYDGNIILFNDCDSLDNLYKEEMKKWKEEEKRYAAAKKQNEYDLYQELKKKYENKVKKEKK